MSIYNIKIRNESHSLKKKYIMGKAKNKTDHAYFMINPEDLKYQYIEHLQAVTINTEVKKLHVKSPEFVKIENEKN